MQLIAEPVTRLIEELNKLPGIGPKTAQRLTFYLLRLPADQARALAEAIVQVKERIVQCSVCFNITEADPCVICSSPDRDRTKICIVEEPLDIVALERSRGFRGLYHVLHGHLSPLDGIGPDDLRMRELFARLPGDGVTEVLLATNPTLEGDNTAAYLAQRLKPLGLLVTRLARGLPVGGDLEYADEITLSRALEGRREI